MKKILLFFIFILIVKLNLSEAQSVSLSCLSQGCFSGVCPNSAVTYVANPYYGIYKNVKYLWQVYPQSATSTTNTGNYTNDNNYTVTWNNVTNSSPIVVLVTAEFSNDTSTTHKSDQKSVTINYLGPINQMTINGTSITNGGVVSVPCGIQNLSVSVPTPVTDPQSGVTYIWQTSWGGTLGNSTNPVNTNSDVGTIDGTISVTAYRTGSSPNCTQQSFVGRITRPRVANVALNGNGTLICSGEIFQLNGTATNLATWSWSSTGGITLTSANESYPYKIAHATSDGTATFVADNACMAPVSKIGSIFGGVRQNIYDSDVYLNGAQAQSFNYINGNTYITVRTRGDACESFKWDVLNGAGYINPISGGCGNSYADPNQGGAVVPFSDGSNCYMSTSNFMRLGVVTANRCGVGASYTLYLQNNSGHFYRMASPNPATNTVSVTLSKGNAPGLLKNIHLVSDARAASVNDFDGESAEGKSHIEKGDDISFDVSNLPRGNYHVILVFQGNKTFTEQIVLKQIFTT